MSEVKLLTLQVEGKDVELHFKSRDFFKRLNFVSIDRTIPFDWVLFRPKQNVFFWRGVIKTFYTSRHFELSDLFVLNKKTNSAFNVFKKLSDN